MFELISVGKDLVQVVDDVGAGVKVYQFGKQTYDYLQGFIGKKQMENVAKLSANTAEKLKHVPNERLSEPSPNVLTPIIERAAQESRAELQELWAALLANSMIDKGQKVRREFLDVVKQLEPVDVVVLKLLQQPIQGTLDVSLSQAWDRFREQLRLENGLAFDEWAVSVRTLTNLGLTSQPNSAAPMQISPLARQFLAACEVN